MKANARITWILIADAMNARVLCQQAPGGTLSVLPDYQLTAPAVKGFSRDLKSDRPGRAFDTGSGQRHAMEPRTDPHDRAKLAFARRVATLLDEAADRNEFQRLVLVAPPRMLGALRSRLDLSTRALISCEIAHDLVRTPLAELSHHLREALAGSGRTYAI
jgi:protein required for attachment to host cells